MALLPRTLAWLVLLAACLSGCSTIGSFTGAVAGIATGAATTNPAVAVTVGIGVKTATDALMKVATRRVSRAEQDAIAAAAGGTSVGESASWEASHPFGFGSRSGEVRVMRTIETALAPCKEILFALADGESEGQRQWFAASICRQADQWKWASAEPAVERWGNLQ